MASQIITDRLVLRPLMAQDEDALVLGLGAIEVARWLAKVAHPYTQADAVEYLDWATGQWPRVAGVTLHGAVIGCVDTTGDGLGYWLAKEHWGQGYMSEAAKVIVSRYFDETGNETLGSGYFEGNAASARVLTKLGFKPTELVEMSCEARHDVLPHQNVVLSRSEWMDQ